MYKNKGLIAALALAIALGGCTTTVGLISPDDLYPKALTNCAPEPTVPPRPADGQPRSDTDKATYVKNLHGAYEDCHDTVDGWAQRRALYVKQYDQQTKGYFTNLWNAITDNTDS